MDKKSNEKPKKKKKDFDDPGISYTDMNVPGMRFYDKHRYSRSRIEFSKKERRQLIRAAFLRILPMLIIGILGFTLAFILVALWLR